MNYNFKAVISIFLLFGLNFQIIFKKSYSAYSSQITCAIKGKLCLIMLYSFCVFKSNNLCY